MPGLPRNQFEMYKRPPWLKNKRKQYTVDVHWRSRIQTRLRRENAAFENQEKHKGETARKKTLRRKHWLCRICPRVRLVKKDQMYETVGHARKSDKCSFHFVWGICFFDRGDPVAIMKSRTGKTRENRKNRKTRKISTLIIFHSEMWFWSLSLTGLVVSFVFRFSGCSCARPHTDISNTSSCSCLGKHWKYVSF